MTEPPTLAAEVAAYYRELLAAHIPDAFARKLARDFQRQRMNAGHFQQLERVIERAVSRSIQKPAISLGQ